jgi:hypothetical protein
MDKTCSMNAEINSYKTLVVTCDKKTSAERPLHGRQNDIKMILTKSVCVCVCVNVWTGFDWLSI